MTSLLQCDYCKNILVDPVIVPCGYSICQAHVPVADTATAPQCFFCGKVHADAYAKHLKLAHLLAVRTSAQNACASLGQQLNVYRSLKLRPVEFIDARFAVVRGHIAAERDRLKAHVCAQVDAAAERALSSTVENRERCVAVLETKPCGSFFAELDAMGGKLAAFGDLLHTNKISEDVWDGIVREAGECERELRAKTAALEASYLLDVEYSFAPRFDYDKPIRFGEVRVVARNPTAPVQQQQQPQPQRPPQPQPMVAAAATSTTTLVADVGPAPSRIESGLTPPTTATPPIQSTTTTITTNSTNTSNNSNEPKRHIRILGHIDYVYCVCFDRTGEFIFTVNVYFTLKKLNRFRFFKHFDRIKCNFPIRSC